MLCDPVSLSVFKKQTLDLLYDNAGACAMVNEYGDKHFDFDELLHQELADTSSIEDGRGYGSRPRVRSMASGAFVLAIPKQGTQNVARWESSDPTPQGPNLQILGAW